MRQQLSGLVLSWQDERLINSNLQIVFDGSGEQFGGIEKKEAICYVWVCVKVSFTRVQHLGNEVEEVAETGAISALADSTSSRSSGSTPLSSSPHTLGGNYPAPAATLMGVYEERAPPTTGMHWVSIILLSTRMYVLVQPKPTLQTLHFSPPRVCALSSPALIDSFWDLRCSTWVCVRIFKLMPLQK